MNIRIKKMHPDAILPTYAHNPESEAGMDLYAIEDITLIRGVPSVVKTGIAIELTPYYEAQVRPRSGLALKHGLQVVNSPGTVDPSYRGEIGVILLLNGGNPCHPTHSWFEIKKGDRIAQLVVAKYSPVVWHEVEELTDSDRGSGGFGSTGLNVCT